MELSKRTKQGEADHIDLQVSKEQTLENLWAIEILWPSVLGHTICWHDVDLKIMDILD